MAFEAKFQNGKLWRGRWEQPKEEFIREPDKFCLGGKKNLLWVSATSKNHWLLLSQAAVTCSGRSSSTRELQTSSFPLKDVQRWERARYPRAHGMPVPPHRLFPTPTHTPCLSNRSTLRSCWFLIPPIQNATRSLHATTGCLICATATRKQTQASSPRWGDPPNPWCWGLDWHRQGGERGSNPQGTPTSLTGLSQASLNPLGSTLSAAGVYSKKKHKKTQTIKNKTKPALSARIFRGGWASQKHPTRDVLKRLDFMCAIALLNLLFKAGKHIIEKPKRLLWLSGGVGVNAKQHSEL